MLLVHHGRKDLANRTISDKTLKEETYEVAINPKYDGNQRDLARMVCKYFDQKTGQGVSFNEELTPEL